MAILKGFPPSNTISPTTRIPWLRETVRKICDLGVESRFRHANPNFNFGAEFMKLPPKYMGDQRAVCYKGDGHTIPGHVYGFSEDLEVTWIEDVYNETAPPDAVWG